MSVRVSYVVIGVLALALAGLAAFVIASDNSLRSEVDELQSTANALHSETKALKKTAAGETAVALKKAEADLRQTASKLKKLEECLPEVQSELNSMQLEHIGTEYYVGTSSQVSSYCSPVVYHSSGG